MEGSIFARRNRGSITTASHVVSPLHFDATAIKRCGRTSLHLRKLPGRRPTTRPSHASLPHAIQLDSIFAAPPSLLSQAAPSCGLQCLCRTVSLMVWTKEETDQLFELCQRFDLPFIVIVDRFPSSWTVEELKDRYYSMARAILSARAPSPGDISGHPLVKEPYNVSQETERKRALSMVLSQTKQQERKDTEVLAEAKRITESRMVARGGKEFELSVPLNAGPESAERAVIPGDTVSPLSNVQLPTAAVAPSTSTADNASILASLCMLCVYLRTYALDQMVQAASSSAGLRTIKRVEQTLQELGVNLKPRVPTKAVCAEHLELRREILTLLNLQKQLQYKEAEGSSFRDGSHADTPGTPKDRTFVPDMSFAGERVGKRDQNRKATGRPSEAPSSPAQSKRPRKMKATDL